MKGYLFASLLFVLGCASGGGHPSICATGERLVLPGGTGDDSLVFCECLPGHVRDADGKGCHVPDPEPTPAPSPTTAPLPTPLPSQLPIPSPAPTPAPSCDAPPMPECGAAGPPEGPWGCCSKGGANLYAHAVEAAVEVVKRNPALVDSSGRVIDEDGYMGAVVAELQRAGYCAVRGGPGDEVGVKLSNGMSEQYDVLLSNGMANSFLAATCKPSRF